MYRLTIPVDSLRRIVAVATIIYLATPIAIFLTGWLRSSIAWAAVTLLGVGVVSFIRSLQASGRPVGKEGVVSAAGLILAVSLLTIPVLLSGAGGIGPRTWDWAKHDAILRDLVANPWPVVYETSEGPVALVYYVAYYLPAAFLGKLAGWTAANGLLFMTTWFGFVLSGLWVVVLGGGAAFGAALFFICFSGMDIAGSMLVQSIEDWKRIPTEFHLEWWAGLWQYSSNASLTFFVPQQAIPGWLGTAIVLDALGKDDRLVPAFLLIALLALWSPFAAIGLLPFLAVYQWRLGIANGPWLRELRRISNLAGLAIGFLLLLYYLSRFGSYSLPELYSAWTPTTTPGGFVFLPATVPVGDFLVRYVLFVFLEFLILAVAVFRILGDRPDSVMGIRTLAVGVAILLTLPLFRYGLYNDFVMRTSIPALFTLQILTLRALFGPRPDHKPAVLVVVICIGALYGANLVRLQAQGVYQQGFLEAVPRFRSVPTLLHIEMYPEIRTAFFGQYLGSIDTPFFRYLSPAIRPVTVDPPRHWTEGSAPP